MAYKTITELFGGLGLFSGEKHLLTEGYYGSHAKLEELEREQLYKRFYSYTQIEIMTNKSRSTVQKKVGENYDNIRYISYKNTNFFLKEDIEPFLGQWSIRKPRMRK